MGGKGVPRKNQQTFGTVRSKLREKLILKAKPGFYKKEMKHNTGNGGGEERIPRNIPQ